MSEVSSFLEKLRQSGFEGDIGDDLASRLVGATDNSIYRIEPDAVLFPKNTDDVRRVAELSSIHGVALTARGGGTGTNGQSLNTGVILDTSRHMTRILSFDAERREVVVEPGVVLDQLNRFLRPHDLFFPPTVSTSSRATLGGMFATDASGKGSRRYGRMSDWVNKADLVLANGKKCTTSTLPGSNDILSQLAQHYQMISTIWPDMNRSLTGYNLRDARSVEGLDGVKLMAGSEGTLALTTSLTLRVTELPKHKSLSVLAYSDCLSALEHVPYLLAADPVAIEFLDDKIVDLAAQTPMWSELKSVFGEFGDARGFLFVEFCGDNPSEVARGLSELSRILSDPPVAFVGQNITSASDQIGFLWEMRKRAVGLLGAMSGPRVGIPFVEDAAVPPEKLSQFVHGFRTILDAHKLEYGMFGHADVGCVHVRPALSMTDQADRELIKPISDQVSALAQEMGGLIWGEHGKGVRGEYLNDYLPVELLNLMRDIKRLFDPHNRLNPGKLFTPDGTDLHKIDEVPFRGTRDETIEQDRFDGLSRAVKCNGNGACFNWAPDDPMCPSYKATGNKTLSPKGRATLLREWMFAKSTSDLDEEIEVAVFRSLELCLSCGSCTSQCPVAIDIPEMKSRFLFEWYQTRPRPLRDRLIRHLDTASVYARRMPLVANAAMRNPVSDYVLRQVFGLVDIPEFSSRPIERELSIRGVVTTGDCLSDADLWLILDSFTASFEAQVVVSVVDLLQQLGFSVGVTPVLPNGKAAALRGFVDTYEKIRSQTNRRLDDFAATGVPLVGLEPAVIGFLRRDYGRSDVLSLDQFLERHRQRFTGSSTARANYTLLSHCTEKTADPQTSKRWQQIFEAAGLSLTVQPSGCCGMAGLFGHQFEHQGMSRKLFDLSWREPVSQAMGTALATGFSCRSQSKRFSGTRLRHPAEILTETLTGERNGRG